MGTKRKKGGKPPSERKTKETGKKNSYDVLSSDSDSGVIFDNNAKKEDLVLVDSSDDDIVVESEGEKSDVDEAPVVKKRKVSAGDNKSPKKQKQSPNELSKNQDFIEFGFSSSEDENDKNFAEYSDDGIISDDESGNRHISKDPSSLYPWIKDQDHSKQQEIADWLTLEIKDFVNYISPSTTEITARNTVIGRLRSTITKFWPDTEVHVFGSSATDLYLPGSDIDMVVISRDGDKEQRPKLYQLSTHLRSKKMAKNIEVIAKAKVPIIKFVDPDSNIHIDVSFERSNGIQAATKIREWLELTPGLREMVLVVKQFLRSRRLNNVHVGGLGGYSTIILCYHFLKLHPRVATGNMTILDNLGSLLIEFFELYGRNFSYDNLVLAIDANNDMPKYLLKRHYPELNASKNPFSIVIQDPSDPQNNISRSSYNLRDVKKAFGGAYQLLIDKCYDLHSATYRARIGQSILGDIIKYRGKERDFNDDRHMVENHAMRSGEPTPALSDDESDGHDGNDKYYFSDITVESEDDDAKEEKEVEVAKLAKENEEQISGLLGIVDDNETEEAKKESKSNLDKNVKRDYWKQKGLEL